MKSSRISAAVRRAVRERADACCEYCLSQANFASHSFAVEHILPLSAGGTNHLDNLAFACQGCNGHKHAKVEAADPADGKVVPLFHPRQQRWREHFRWSDDYTHIVGITSTGRATVRALNLNRQSVVNLRRALHALGEHPPQRKE